MRRVLRALQKHWKMALLSAVVLPVSVWSFFGDSNGSPERVTTTAERGTVNRITSISGTLKATQTARLGFPSTGILESISVVEGETVSKGHHLAVLAHADLIAEYEEARAAFRIAQADYDELIEGMRPEERDVAQTKVAIAEEELIRVTREENERVESAYRTLLSSDLVARPEDRESDDIAPLVSGTYTCGEGAYTLSLFRSGAQSGYSYRFSGLESGVSTAYSDTPGLLGTCGLTVQFGGQSYDSAEWTIAIPNKESDSYVTNMNAYNLARTARDNAISGAEQDLALAKQTDTLGNAAPRSEALTRASARVSQAAARVAAVQAQIDDHTLIAPFSGIITSIEPIVGEPVGSDPVVTMISYEAFELTALIPEIDVTRVTSGQKARVIFDARQEETLSATVLRISPLAREINGVSYFEAALMLDTAVDWLRGGLNADIDIVLESAEDVVRIPQRFLIEESGAAFVLIPDGKKTQRVPVSVTFSGNDGFVAVEGLQSGDTVVAP